MSKCLTRDCKKDGKLRGLCHPCYLMATRLVREGRVSWEALEVAGKANKPVLRGKRIDEVRRRDWFLEVSDE